MHEQINKTEGWMAGMMSWMTGTSQGLWFVFPHGSKLFGTKEKKNFDSRRNAFRRNMDDGKS